ncbi:MAG: HPr family phosphocarrier protein [Eubacteriaceae bacterium]|nr:HPr family phosphocarrier protein [Eubacteriaceae bacterium]MBR0383985.1 HPr family phosphocarrier protein [Eubacteriaceae bacterium]
MYSQKIEIKNPTGLHARPAAEFCKKASTFKADIHIKRLTPPESIMNGKSVIGVMAMGLAQGTEIEIIGEGRDEEEAVKALAAMVEGGFGEI